MFIAVLAKMYCSCFGNLWGYETGLEQWFMYTSGGHLTCLGKVSWVRFSWRTFYIRRMERQQDFGG